jgi:uncharacterized protein YebE (UPF0316 family)
MIESLLGAALIFCLRIGDVSLGTMRSLFVFRGHRWIAALLGALEAGIFIFAISRVLATAGQDPVRMVGYARGFAAGPLLGMTVERWIASGTVLVRVISPRHAVRLRALLINEGFGVTAVRGEGKDGEVTILFVVAPRRRGKVVIRLVRELDPEVFITIEPVSQAIGGHMPGATAPDPASMKK